MKKFMVIMLCCCFFLSSFSFAISNSMYDVEIPSNFELVYGEEENALYSNGDMLITIAAQNAEFGTGYKDVNTILEEESYSLSLYGLSDDAKVEKINGVNFLKELSTTDDSQVIMYLGTTGTKLALIIFAGEKIDEDVVNNVMSTFKLKGIPTGIYGFFLDYGLIILVVIICGASWLIKANRKAKKLEKEYNQTIEKQEYLVQEFGNTYSNPTQQTQKTYYTNDPMSQKKNDWNI